MDFWKSALAAAEMAAEAAKDLGKKGLEVVEATAEEASKKLHNLNLHDAMGAGGGSGAPEPPSQAELEAYGVTPAFAEFVRSLNYSTVRDFPTEHLLPPAEAPGGGEGSVAAGGGAPPYRLNPWQVRHATLVVQALKEVNELRFVLCPKYMTDEHFWHVYFTIARKNLPEEAYSWAPGRALPFAEKAAGAAGADSFSLTELGDQLKRLGSKIQNATTAGAQRGLQLTSSTFGGAGGAGASSSSSGGGTGGAALPSAAAAGLGEGAQPGPGGSGGTAAAAGAAGDSLPISSLLEDDPDLEAYLQVAINTSGGDSQGGDDDGSGGYDAVGDDDLDLDSYINELSAEVDAAEEEESSAAATAEAEAAAEAEVAAAAAAAKKD